MHLFSLTWYLESKTKLCFYRIVYRALDKLKKQIKAAKDEKKRLREIAAAGGDVAAAIAERKREKEKEKETEGIKLNGDHDPEYHRLHFES